MHLTPSHSPEYNQILSRDQKASPWPEKAYAGLCWVLLSFPVCVLSHFSCVQLFVIAWTAAFQAPLWDFPGKNSGVGFHALLQGIFPTQVSTLTLLHWQAGSLPLSHWGSHIWVLVTLCVGGLGGGPSCTL